MNTRIKRLSALNYFGSKSRHLDWLLPLQPPRNKVSCFLEGFCGSAAFLLNNEPYPIETINDVDGMVWNFFTVLRDHSDQLIPLLELTPYSRQEFVHCADYTDDKIENARRFFVRSLQAFGGITHSVRRLNSYRVDLTQTRRGMAATVSKWLTKIEGLPEVVDRLKMVQIDNRSIFYLMNKFNMPGAYAYLDPPYHHSTRTANNDYKYEFTHEQHLELAMVNNESKAMIMISHYDDPLYDKLYPEPKWKKIYGPDRKSNLGKAAAGREVVYINY